MIRTQRGLRATQLALLLGGVLAWLGWPVCRPAVIARAEPARDGGWAVVPPLPALSGNMDARGRLYLVMARSSLPDGKAALAVRGFDTSGQRSEPRPLVHDGQAVRSSAAALTVSPSGHRWWLLTNDRPQFPYRYDAERPRSRLWALSDDGSVSQTWTTTFTNDDCAQIQAVGEDTLVVTTITDAIWRYRAGASAPVPVDIGDRAPALIDADGRFYIQPDDASRRSPCRSIEPDGRLSQYVWPALSRGRALFLFAHTGRYLYATGKPSRARGTQADAGRVIYRVGRLGLPQFLLNTARFGLPEVGPPLAVDARGGIWFVGHDAAADGRGWVLLRARCAPRWRCWR